mgnify:CR=1 FL=1|jgi:hypothetical protein
MDNARLAQNPYPVLPVLSFETLRIIDRVSRRDIAKSLEYAQSQSDKGTTPDAAISGACDRSGASGGVSGHGEAGHESGAAAGLVIYKTSPTQTPNLSPSHWEKNEHVISFDKPSQRIKRLKGLKKSVYLAGELHKLNKPGFRPSQAWVVTLTYANDDQWQPNHISDATDAYRGWCKRRGIECKYVWVGELTNRGRVHYHLIAWLPVGVRMTFWDKPRRVKGKKTSAFWPYGMSNTEQSRKGVAYLMKYLSKMGELHEFPQGMRLHGCGGLSVDARAIKAWSNLPQWVKCDHGVKDVKRLCRGFLDITTGELLPPMYRRKFVPGGVVITQLREMPEKLFDHGAFSTVDFSTFCI